MASYRLDLGAIERTAAAVTVEYSCGEDVAAADAAQLSPACWARSSLTPFPRKDSLVQAAATGDVAGDARAARRKATAPLPAAAAAAATCTPPSTAFSTHSPLSPMYYSVDEEGNSCVALRTVMASVGGAGLPATNASLPLAELASFRSNTAAAIGRTQVFSSTTTTTMTAAAATSAAGAEAAGAPCDVRTTAAAAMTPPSAAAATTDAAADADAAALPLLRECDNARPPSPAFALPCISCVRGASATAAVAAASEGGGQSLTLPPHAGAAVVSQASDAAVSVTELCGSFNVSVCSAAAARSPSPSCTASKAYTLAETAASDDGIAERTPADRPPPLPPLSLASRSVLRSDGGGECALEGAVDAARVAEAMSGAVAAAAAAAAVDDAATAPLQLRPDGAFFAAAGEGSDVTALSPTLSVASGAASARSLSMASTYLAMQNTSITSSSGLVSPSALSCRSGQEGNGYSRLAMRRHRVRSPQCSPSMEKASGSLDGIGRVLTSSPPRALAEELAVPSRGAGDDEGDAHSSFSRTPLAPYTGCMLANSSGVLRTPAVLLRPPMEDTSFAAAPASPCSEVKDGRSALNASESDVWADVAAGADDSFGHATSFSSSTIAAAAAALSVTHWASRSLRRATSLLKSTSDRRSRGGSRCSAATFTVTNTLTDRTDTVSGGGSLPLPGAAAEVRGGLSQTVRSLRRTSSGRFSRVASSASLSRLRSSRGASAMHSSRHTSVRHDGGADAATAAEPLRRLFGSSSDSLPAGGRALGGVPDAWGRASPPLPLPLPDFCVSGSGSGSARPTALPTAFAPTAVNAFTDLPQLADALSARLYGLFRTPPSVHLAQVTECLSLYRELRHLCHGLSWETLLMLLLPEDYIALRGQLPPQYALTYADFTEVVELGAMNRWRESRY